MNITNDMLKAAVEKAVEAGLLPKYARKPESVAEREVMKLVLQAALDARPEGISRTGEKKPADLAVSGQIQFKKSWRRQEE